MRSDIKDVKEKVEGFIRRVGDGKPDSFLRGDKSFPCRKCDERFDNMKQLKLHVKASHPANIACRICDKRFEKNHELEHHLTSKHGKGKTYKCFTCGLAFVMKWRLRKHEEGHKSIRIQKNMPLLQQ